MKLLETNRWLKYTVLLIILAIPFVYYDYFSLLCAPPVGTHIWRQTDSLSFAWCYWKNGFDFFHPQILNRSYGDGFAVSEFPILQYFIALFYNLFGFHWWVSKAIYVGIYFLGLIAIFRITKHFIKDLFWAYFMAALFFTAPTLVFYGNSCIPDVAALSFSFIGFSLYLDFRENNRKQFLWISMLFFCLSGLMKMTYLLLFFAWFGTVFLLSIRTFFIKKILHFKISILIFCVIAINVIWYFWSANYNNINEHIYFLNSINPIWHESTEKAYILKRTFTEWALRFFASPTNYFFLFSLLFLPIGYKKGNKYLSLTTLLLLIGCILYYLLWYLQFLVHDYYTILFYSLVLFSFLNLFSFLKKNFSKLFNNNFLKIAGILLLVANAVHVKHDLQRRYEEGKLYPADKYLLEDGLVPYIRSIGIKETDYIAVTTDGSPQIMLCALQTPGFTEFHVGRFDTEKLNNLRKKGAKYLIIINSIEYEELIKKLGQPIGIYKQAIIYKI
ncbi:MAG: hypothetical protein RJA25_1790 [Bacteroidota bacterium]